MKQEGKKSCACGVKVAKNAKSKCQTSGCQWICKDHTKMCAGSQCDDSMVCFDHGYQCMSCSKITCDDCLLCFECPRCKSNLVCAACGTCSRLEVDECVVGADFSIKKMFMTK